MGSLKSAKLNVIRKGIAVLAALIIVMAAASPSYAKMVQAPGSGEINKPPMGEADAGTTLEHNEERIEEIPYKTLYKYSSDVARGESRVEIEGENGTKKVVGKVTTKDGAIVDRKEISTTIIKKPVDELILIGSLNSLPEMAFDFEEAEPAIEPIYEKSVYVSLPEESKGTKDGQEVVDFALDYIGLPYVWAGASLTSGCDCSGFVHAVFTACGYDVPRNGYEEKYPISMDELRPGDVITYPDHYAIYIGGGMEISALNWRYGVCITPVGTVSGYYMAVRIIE